MTEDMILVETEEGTLPMTHSQLYDYIKARDATLPVLEADPHEHVCPHCGGRKALIAPVCPSEACWDKHHGRFA